MLRRILLMMILFGSIAAFTRMSLPMLFFSLIALSAIAVTMYVTASLFRQDKLTRLFNAIRKRSRKNQPVETEADAAIAMQHANTAAVAEPIHIVVSPTGDDNMLAYHLLKAEIRYLVRQLEVETHGQGFLNLPAIDRSFIARKLDAARGYEKVIGLSSRPVFHLLVELRRECEEIKKIYTRLLITNKRTPMDYAPLFFIVQKDKLY